MRMHPWHGARDRAIIWSLRAVWGGVVLFLLVPMLLAGARGTMLVMEGGPAAEVEAPGWMMALLLFNALHWSIGGVFYAIVLDDG